MSKFIIDELPYYGHLCLIDYMGLCDYSADECPRYWSKYKVCSNDNPHECIWLKEREQK